MKITRLLGQLMTRFVDDRRGGFAILFGIAGPVLLLLLAGGVEVAEVVKAKRELQWDVDTAALNGARELGTDQSSATATRAQTMAASLATQSTPRWAVVTTSGMDAPDGSVTVDQTASRPSFFGSLLPPGGWHLHVTSTAVSNVKAPLCVLGLQSTTGQVVSLQSASKMTAAGCLVQSDADIAVSSSGAMQASAVHSVGAAQGPISPFPITDAPAIADPFTSLSISVPSQCTDSGIDVGNGSQTLNPGVHCGNVQIQGSGTLTLNPGDHYFVNTSFNVNGNAKLLGSDVVLVLKGSTLFQFQGTAYLSFNGRQSGSYAGFVIVSDRSYTGTLSISTDSAHVLHGTIYLPNGSLAVSGSGNKVADQSPWTVVVAQKVSTSGSANLIINSNYASSSVPVPSGVGNSLGDLPHLSR
ncbi:MAG: TadE/TadG family type IV pilus assembly protein [Janthinobacterium lividum]